MLGALGCVGGQPTHPRNLTLPELEAVPEELAGLVLNSRVRVCICVCVYIYIHIYIYMLVHLLVDSFMHLCIMYIS